MAITWRNVDAPNLDADPGSAIEGFQKSLSNFNESVETQRDRASKRDAERLFGSMMSGEISQEEAMQQAGQRGGLTEMMDLVKVGSKQDLEQARIQDYLSKVGAREQKNQYLPAEFQMKQEKHASDLQRAGLLNQNTAMNTQVSGYGLQKQMSEDQVAQQSAAIDEILARNGKNVSELTPEEANILYQGASEQYGSAAAQGSLLGKRLEAEQKARLEAQKKGWTKEYEARGEMNAWTAKNSSQAALDLLRQREGGLVWTRNPQTNQPIQVPASKMGKAVPKNNGEVLEYVMADNSRAAALGLGQKMKEWGFSNPFGWGDVDESALSKKFDTLPEQDQHLISQVFSLMQIYANPNEALQIVDEAIAKSSRKGKVNKKEASRLIDLALEDINSISHGQPMDIRPD